ncbi:MAG: hypothetical protein LBE10_06090 [Treponema sp.]|nr:hypothetical protein [Treponema sp.]
MMLNKQTADALCTVIALGFMKNNAGETIPHNRTVFQYSGEESKASHDTLAQFLNDKIFAKQGSTIQFSEAPPQSEMPCIVGKTRKISENSEAKSLVDDFWSYITGLSSHAQAKDSAPYGAYIGGRASVGTVDIVGPSYLEPYAPTWRTKSPGEKRDIDTSYKKAVEATNASINIVKNISATTYKKITIRKGDACCIRPKAPPLADNEVFKSYHGMIRAMVAYPPGIDTHAAYFEIALGVNTSKVSSCIPCSIFMSANEVAATSTHLGRGDNWNIPPGQKPMTEKWRKAVNKHYETGMILCGASYSEINSLKTALLESRCSDKIPDIFLEALTFEGPFLEKINRALAIPK